MDLPLDRIREAVTTVARELDARLVVLFGSAARRGPRAAEDLDIGILARGPLDALEATNRLIRRLGVQQVDIVDLQRADPLLLALAARDGICLYEAGPGEYARFVSLAARRYADTRKFRDAERQEIRDFLGSAR